MKELKPIRKPIARKWFRVMFSYTYMEPRSRYDAEHDLVVKEEEPIDVTSCEARVLASSAADASKQTREYRGLLDGARIAVEGSIVILGVDEESRFVRSETSSVPADPTTVDYSKFRMEDVWR